MARIKMKMQEKTSPIKEIDLEDKPRKCSYTKEKTY